MYTLEDVYKTFPSGCTEDYKILRAFEMGKQTSDKKIRELEQQIEKMKRHSNCKHRSEYNEFDPYNKVCQNCCNLEKWEFGN